MSACAEDGGTLANHTGMTLDQISKLVAKPGLGVQERCHRKVTTERLQYRCARTAGSLHHAVVSSLEPQQAAIVTQQQVLLATTGQAVHSRKKNRCCAALPVPPLHANALSRVRSQRLPAATGRCCTGPASGGLACRSDPPARRCTWPGPEWPARGLLRACRRPCMQDISQRLTSMLIDVEARVCPPSFGVC